MNNTTTLTIKMRKGKHSTEYRRATIPTPASFAAFSAAFADAFGVLDADARLKYADEEGDLIALGNESDYQEALRVVANAKPSLLRVTVCGAGAGPHHHGGHHCRRERREEAARAAGCPAFAHQQPPMMNPLAALLQTAKASLPDLLANPALRSMAEGLMGSGMLKVVTPYVCDACNCDIAGDRFHSTTNANFDLCKACMDSPVGASLAPEHKFERITALESLVHTLQNGGSFDAYMAPGCGTDAEPVKRHHAICDVCNSPIVGLRHKSLDADDYDECNVCFVRANSAAHAAGHAFYTIDDVNVRAVPEDVLKQHREKKAAEAATAQAAAAAAAEAAQAAARAAAVREAEVAAQAAREAELKAAAAREAATKAAAAITKPAPVEHVTEPELAVKEPSAFERNLNTLDSMGFCDRKRNIQVLVRQRNKLFEAIQELLSNQ